jgi:hypothetical protein
LTYAFVLSRGGYGEAENQSNAAPSAMPKARLSINIPNATPSPTPIASPIAVPSVTSFLDFDRLSLVKLVPQPVKRARIKEDSILLGSGVLGFWRALPAFKKGI